jgi:hypothetical protein
MLRLAAAPPDAQHPHGLLERRNDTSPRALRAPLIVVRRRGDHRGARFRRSSRRARSKHRLLGLAQTAAVPPRSTSSVRDATDAALAGRSTSIALEADGRHLLTDVLDSRSG